MPPALQDGLAPTSGRRLIPTTLPRKAVLASTAVILLVAGATPAASTELESSLPGSSADALRPPLQKNQAVGSAAPLAPGGPSKGILDDFNRSDGPLSSNPAWSPVDPLGGPFTLSVISNRAGVFNETNNVSYRLETYPGDVELYASIPVKPATNAAVGLAIAIRQEGGSSWDSYWLTWDVLSGTDILRIEKIRNNVSVGNIVSIPLELVSGDRFMVRRVGTQLEGWTYQAGSWEKRLEGTDGEFLGAGKVGLFARGSTLRIDDLGGGSLEGPPITQSTGTCEGKGVHAEAGSDCQKDPVNSLTGAFTTEVTDLTLPGIGVPFVWRRSYTSLDTTAGRLGPAWTDAYATSLAVQANGDVILRGDEGQQVFYTKQADGSFVGARGARSTLASVAGGYSLVRQDQVTYLFDSQGRLLSIKDRNAQGLTFAYDGQGQLQMVTDSLGRQIAVTFAGGLLTRVTLPDGRYVEYSYTSGRLSSVRDARSGTTQYLYDAGGRLEKILDQNGHQVVRNVYDPLSGRVSDQYNALNDHSTFAWDPATQTSTVTDARLNQWKDVYAGNLLVDRIDPLANHTRFAYDSDLNVRQVTDARNNMTTMSYDASGNLRTRTALAPLAYLEEWTYNARNDPLTYRDGRGNVTDYGYDTAGNLTSVLAPDADGGGPLGRPQTLYGRDPAGTGLLTSITDPRVKQTLFSYTSGNLSEIRTQLGNRTTLCYDGSGRLIGLVDPRGTQSCSVPNDYRWSYTYNDADQLRTQTDPLGNVSELDYDPAGNLSLRRDANLHQTTYGYDDANRLASVTAPDPDAGGPLSAPVTLYAYDPVGNLGTRTDANLHATTYGYDTANRLTSVTAPGNRIWTYAYDANGNVTQLVDANGNATPTAGDGQTTYGYDVLNRLGSIDYSDTTPDVTLIAYDANDNRTQLTDGPTPEIYLYDPLDRLTSATRGTSVFSYGYDLVNLTQATYPGQSAISYAFDDDERLQSAGPSGQTTSYVYDPAANLTTTTLPTGNGYVETRTYDRAGRLVDLENKKGASTLSRFATTPDPVGNPLSVVRSGSLAQTQTYAYDAMDRLTSVCFQAGACPGGSDPFIRWTYDGVGNRLTEARPGTSTTNYSYNVADELTQAGSTAYTYDQNGNELSAGSRTFAYHLANRVKQTTLATTTTTYTYDGDGKRVQASTGTQASKKTNFLWDLNQGLPQIALERDGNNNLIRRYTYGARRISQTAGSNTSYHLHDGLGSVANLTSSSGATQWTWSYEPYGAIRTEQKATGNQPDNLMKFTGEYLDPTGLYHLRARQYDPVSGRFLMRDPMRPSVTDGYVSAYSYAGNRPTAFVDPSGEFGLPGIVVGGVVGGIAGGVGAIAQGNTDIRSIAKGVAAGAAIGAVIGGFPLAAPLELALIGAGGDLAAQHLTGVGACGTNWGSVIGAGVGGAVGGVSTALVKSGLFAIGGGEWSREAIAAGVSFNKNLLLATLGTAIGRCQAPTTRTAGANGQNGK